MSSMKKEKYTFLQETTNWGDETPNHIYIMEGNKSTKIVGYIPSGENTIYFFDKPLSFDKRKRTFKEVNLCRDDFEIASPG